MTKVWNPVTGYELHPERLRDPLQWKRPGKVRVSGDLFHPNVPLDYVGDIFLVTNACKHLEFQVLTRHPERARQIIRDLQAWDWAKTTWTGRSFRVDLPLKNVLISPI